jgi:hypothetical protein
VEDVVVTSRRWGAAVAAVLWGLPSVALACPSCANRGDGSTLSTVYFLGAMMLVPFCIAAVVVRVIQRLPEDGNEADILADSVSSKVESR